MGKHTIAVIISLMFVCVIFSGCIFSSTKEIETHNVDLQYPSLNERYNLDFQDNHTFSYVLQRGGHFPLEVQEVFIEVDTSDVWETGPDSSIVPLANWLQNNTL